MSKMREKTSFLCLVANPLIYTFFSKPTALVNNKISFWGLLSVVESFSPLAWRVAEKPEGQLAWLSEPQLNSCTGLKRSKLFELILSVAPVKRNPLSLLLSCHVQSPFVSSCPRSPFSFFLGIARSLAISVFIMSAVREYETEREAMGRRIKYTRWASDLWEPYTVSENHNLIRHHSCGCCGKGWQQKQLCPPQLLFSFETWVLKQMHLEQRCGKKEKHKCCLLGALQTENYCVSNTIDFVQQLIFQSGCSMSESLRTLSRRNMIVS